MRYLAIEDKDFEIFSKFASTTRTVNNTLDLLSALEFHNKDNSVADRIKIAIDELEMLRDIIEHLNNTAKALKFMECNFATTSLVRDAYVKHITEAMKTAQELIVKICTTECKS